MARAVARSRSIWTSALWVLVAVVLGGAGMVATLWAMGVPLPFLSRGPEIALPVNVRPLPAYSKVARADLVDTETKQIKYQHLPLAAAVGRSWTGTNAEGQPATDRIAKAYLRDGQIQFDLAGGETVGISSTTSIGGALPVQPNDVIGRVLKIDKTPFLAFSDDNFYPKGTHEGITGGIPQGKRAYRLDVSKVAGFHGLKPHDHFDLLASIPLDFSGKRPGSHGQLSSLALSGAAAQLGMTKQAEIHPIIQDGVIVSPVTTGDMPVLNRTLTSSSVQSQPVQEIVIAVDPEEVAELSQAVSLEFKLTVVARSGQVDGAPAKGDAKGDARARPTAASGSAKDETPGLNPLEHIRFVEVMRGDKVEVIAVPNGNYQGPVIAEGAPKARTAATKTAPAGPP